MYILERMRAKSKEPDLGNGEVLCAGLCRTELKDASYAWYGICALV